MSPQSQNLSSVQSNPVASNASTTSNGSGGNGSSQNGSKKDNLSALSKQDVVISQQGHSYSKQEIREIQNAIEKGLTCYKSKMEIFTVLKTVDQNVVSMVWQKLEQNNPRFFTAYLIRLAVIKQVKVFQQLLAEQNKLKNQQSKNSTPTVNLNSSIVNNSSNLSMSGNNVSLIPFNQGNSPILNSIHGNNQHSSHMMANSMNSMNMPMFNAGIIGQSFDQGRRSSITSLTGQPNSSILSQTVNNNRFPSAMMPFNNSFMQMQPHVNFTNNQQFTNNSMGYQNPNFGQMGSLLPQGANDQQFNPYSSFATFSLAGNQGLTHPSSNNSGNFPIGHSSHKSSNGKSNDSLDDVFTM